MKQHSKTRKQVAVETIGIDLGDKMSRYCIVNQSGAVVEEGSFRNQVSSIETHFSGESRRIALEAGAQSAWISRELQRLGHEVIVANARELKWITGSDTKNDPADARKLARLARADVKLLAPIEHRSAEQTGPTGRDSCARCNIAGAHAAHQRRPRPGQGIRCALAQVDYRHVRSTRTGGSARDVARGAGRIAGTD
jgi:hypothetical protein